MKSHITKAIIHLNDGTTLEITRTGSSDHLASRQFESMFIAWKRDGFFSHKAEGTGLDLRVIYPFHAISKITFEDVTPALEEKQL